MECAIEACTGSHVARGYCDKHYRRLLRRGHAEIGIREPVRSTATPDERLRHHGWDVTESGCWAWKGGRDKAGYGRVRYRDRATRTHRLAYETWVGPIPEGHVVRHKCDVRHCINPAHLETGTQRDNMDDMVSRGRGRGTPGVNHRAAKLTEQDVLDIRREYSYGVLTQQMLADVYGLTQAVVSKIIHRRTWRHVE